jgi:hypothetical protein
MEYTKIIREILALNRPPEAPEPPDPKIPTLYAISAGEEGWILNTYPGQELDALDRQVLWATFADVVDEVLAKAVPEVKALVSSPSEYSDTAPGIGSLRYTYPPPASGMAERFWWQRITDELPAINKQVAARIDANWLDYVTSRDQNRRSPAHLRAARSAAVDAARQRNGKPAHGRGRSLG